MLFKIGVLNNFAIFTGKHLCLSLFLITWQVFRKHLVYINTSGRLLLRVFNTPLAIQLFHDGGYPSYHIETVSIAPWIWHKTEYNRRIFFPSSFCLFSIFDKNSNIVVCRGFKYASGYLNHYYSYCSLTNISLQVILEIFSSLDFFRNFDSTNFRSFSAANSSIWNS